MSARGRKNAKGTGWHMNGELERIVTREMEQVTQLSVPLSVECNHGKNWLEAH